MSYRYKDSQTEPSSLPRRYFSLPKNYSSQDSTSGKDSSLSSRYRTTSSSSATASTTPLTQSSRYGSSRTYGTATHSSLMDDHKRPSSRRSGITTHSSASSRTVGNSTVPRKNSYPLSQPLNERDLTPSYTARHVSSTSRRGSGNSSSGKSHNSSWAPGDIPVRQRSSISLRETESVWGPDGPPTRQYSSSSLHDSPFTLPSRRTYSSTQGSSDTETQITSRRKTSPIEIKPVLVPRSTSPPTTVSHGRYIDNDKDTTSSHRKTSPVEMTSSRSISPPTTMCYDNYNKSETDKLPSGRKTSPAETMLPRSISPPTVEYQGTQTREEKPASPKSPVVQYSGSVPRKESPSSRSEASTSSGSRRGSSGSQGGSSDNGDELQVNEQESSAARDISLLSREIASAYEGSLSRSDSRKGQTLLQKQQSVSKKEEKPENEKMKLDKEGSEEKKIQKDKKVSREKSPAKEKGGLFLKGHKRSASTGSPSIKDETKKPGRKLSGVLSRKKTQHTDSEGEVEERSRRKGLFSHKGSKDSVKDANARSVSPPPRRKISSPGKFFSYSSDSKTTPELPKKFSVPGKFFTSKESKSGGESSDLESESGRSQSNSKRRVSLPGLLGFPRSSSAERAPTVQSNPDPSVDPALLKRRRSNFKKAQSFDLRNDPLKNSMLSKLKFWDHSKKDKSPDSRASTSPEEGRSHSLSSVESPARKNSENSAEEELEDKMPRLNRRSRERAVKVASSQQTDTSVSTKPDLTSVSGEKDLTASQKGTHSAKGDDLNTSDKEVKVFYVGPVEGNSPAEQRTQSKVNDSENKSTVVPAEVSIDAKTTEPSVQQVKENSSDGSTRDTVSKLRERRRRRREERERFFASLGPATKEANKTQEAVQKGQVQQEPASVKTDAVDSNQDKVDGGNTNVKGRNDKRVEPPPKLSSVGKRATADNVLQKGSKLKGGKPRYQTIASSVHADIIANLIREKGFNSKTTNEVKIPSVADLRAKFLISKDDAKVSPSRIILKLNERPNSVAGEVLSPTEMKKFDDITFSLAKKSSSDDIKAKKVSDSSSDSLPKLDTQWKTIPKKGDTSPPSSPPVKSSSKKKKTEKKVSKEESKVSEEQDVSMESATLKKRRGSKTKKRKISLFGTDKDKGKDKEVKEPKTPEEDADMPQHGAVSAAIKSMFTRKSSLIEKNKTPRKQRLKSAPDSTARSEVIKTATDRERKKSAPVEIARKSSQVVEVHPVKVERKETKDDEKVAKTEEAKNLSKEKGIELQPMSEIEDKPKERKSLKKPTKNKKRTFKSSLKPFGMMKTKSESNLAQRFDFVAVDIPLDNEPVAEKTNEQVISNEPDKLIKQEETINSNQKGRRPSVFEESLKEFYGETIAKEKGDLPSSEITLEDLDAISGQTTEQLKSVAGDKMRIRPKRHHKTTANPVKSLQQRNDVRTDTEVERPRIEKKQVTSEHPVIKRKKKKYKDPDNLWRRHTLDLAASALAGLASTEDFTKVRLRKTAGPDEKDEFRGTQPTMLIHIKGRRHLQVRLIEPSVKSLNSGDCFALVTEKDLFSWIGKDCNPYEKAKVTEIVSKIKAKSELDCKARDIVTIEDGDLDYDAALEKFLNILKGDPGSNRIRDSQSLPKDEEYEKGCVKGNMVYKIHWTDPPSLMPVESMCGHIPQVSILDTKEVFIFDFGSELYVWNGQQSLSGQRKSAFALARQLYEEPFKPHGIYDPIFPYGKSENCNVEVDNKIASQRPSWTLFARLHEKAETILFREKFLDWPDPTKIIRMKGHPSMLELTDQEKPPPVELKPYDPKNMLKPPPSLECQTFEGVNVGRGKGVPTVWVGDIYKEGNLVTTVGLTVWHINEYRHFELPPAHHGHFHSGEGYVIRWAYFVLADRIVKDRKSRCRSTVAGRVRCAYFFWQGNDCSVNEKGAAAIMAVELDEEKGPQVRVIQGKESPVFLHLFKGQMIIHNGSVPKCWFDPEKKNPVDESTATFSDTSTTRLYVIRNEEPEEACLNQVKASSYSLRSRTSFVLVVRKEAHVYLWHGCKSSSDSRKTAKVAAGKIQERKSVECNMAGLSEVHLSEVEEGNEPDEFWKAIGGKKYYCSLAHDPSKHNYQPRLFELSSATGKFTASEVLCPSRSEPKLCPFPYIQEDLYTANQPALFIVDGYYDVYVWEGWMPEEDDDVRTGSGRQRWDRDRRLAMETALNYAKEAGKRVSHRVYVVYAGMEPMTFKVLFPYWNDTPDVIRIQKQDGKQPNVRHSASDLLEEFTKDFYTLAELQKVPPPQGVDPAKLEVYLSDSTFQDVFKMDKEAFKKLPGWKQVNLKKAVGLF